MVAAEGDADRPIRFEVGHLDLGWHPLYDLLNKSRGIAVHPMLPSHRHDPRRAHPLQGHAPVGDHQGTSINDRRTSARIVTSTWMDHQRVAYLPTIDWNSRSDRQRYRITLEAQC